MLNAEGVSTEDFLLRSFGQILCLYDDNVRQKVSKIRRKRTRDYYGTAARQQNQETRKAEGHKRACRSI